MSYLYLMPDRFVEKVALDENGCWLWQGAQQGPGYREGAGYGSFRWGGTTRRAHRVAYELLMHPIPPGLQLDHLCRVRLCVNPAHLEPVCQRENLLRGDGLVGVNARKTHCVHGHEFTEQNTWLSKRGHRYCRTCNARRQRATQQRKRTR